MEVYISAISVFVYMWNGHTPTIALMLVFFKTRCGLPIVANCPETSGTVAKFDGLSHCPSRIPVFSRISPGRPAKLHRLCKYQYFTATLSLQKAQASIFQAFSPAFVLLFTQVTNVIKNSTTPTNFVKLEISAWGSGRRGGGVVPCPWRYWF